MKTLILTFLLMTVSQCMSEPSQEEDDPFLYDTEAFEEAVQDDPHFIMFFAPWCGHCQRLKPIWRQLTDHYQKDGKVKIAKVDCTAETKLCSDHGVTGYPTLKFFEPEKDAVRYNGGREFQYLKTFVDDSIAQVGKAGKKAEKVGVDVDEGLYELTADNFDDHTATGYHFVKFYAPWCGHCKRLEPVWKELAEAYEDGKIVKIGRVDCTKSQDLCRQNEVKGYPTLLWFKDGKMVEKYQGGRQLDAFQQYVSKMTGTPGKVQEEDDKEQVVPEVFEGLHELSDVNFQSIISTGDVFIKFFAPWCGHCKRMEPAWKELAREFKDHKKVKIARVDCTKHSSVCQSSGVKGYPTLKYFRDGVATDNAAAGRDLDSLKAFVNKMLGETLEEKEEVQQEEEPEHQEEKEEVPEVVKGLYELTDSNYEELTSTGDFFIKFFAPWCGHCKRMEPAWKELAKAYESDPKVRIGRVDCTKSSSVCSGQGVRGYPTLKYFRNGEALDGSPSGRDIGNLKSFVAKMSGQEEEPQQQQEEEEEEEEEEKAPEGPEVVEGLYELTADSYEETTAAGDFFIKFFAPWCGHCKRMEPAWKELAKAYEFDPKVRIARVDCTKHSSVCQSHGVRGYPTLKYFRNGEELDGSPSGRDLESLKSFVAKMSQVPEKEEKEVEQEEEQEEDEEPEEAQQVVEGLYELTEDNFDELTGSGGFFIKFFAPWCGHCKAMEPAWKGLAKAYESDTRVKIGRVDCTKSRTLCQAHGAKGYPTLKFFNNGEAVDGSPADRDFDNLKAFVEWQLKRLQKTLTLTGGAISLDADSFDSTVADGLTFVMFYAPWCGHCKKLSPVWDELATVSFSHVTVPVRIAKVDCDQNAKICDEHDVESFPTLKLFVDGEGTRFNEVRNINTLEAFVLEHAEDAGYIPQTEDDGKEQKRDEL